MVIPSVLDGGNYLILANFPFDHGLDCAPEVMQVKPQSSYTVVPRSLLCNCALSSELAYLLPDLGSCSSNQEKLSFHYAPNAAFFQQFKDVLSNYTNPSLPYAN